MGSLLLQSSAAVIWMGWAGLAAGGSFKLDFEWSTGWRRRGCAPRDSGKEGSELIVSRSEDGRDDEWSSLGVGLGKHASPLTSVAAHSRRWDGLGQESVSGAILWAAAQTGWTGVETPLLPAPTSSWPCFSHVGRPPYWATECFNGSNVFLWTLSTY